MVESGNQYAQCGLLLDENKAKLTSFSPHNPDSHNRKCKIVCTMGPSCWYEEMLIKLIDAGMNIVRLNFSHATIEGATEVTNTVRNTIKTHRPNKSVAILLDTKGPEVRTGFFSDAVKAAGGKLELKTGAELKLMTDYEFKAVDNTAVAISYPKLPEAVKPGQVILCADGALSLKVKSCGSDHVVTEIVNDFSLGEKKNANLPGVKVDLPVLQEKDVKDILQFGIPMGVDFIAASFVQSKEDVQSIRKTLGLRGRAIKIISKIENQEGINNIDEIIAESDGIMVARGDMGMEIDIEKVGLVQKMLIRKCNLAGKPVITATQMLDSMERAPRPTRAEATDVLNAVLDGTDAVMLSGETANGKFPEESVHMLRHICEQAESVLDYKQLYLQTRMSSLKLSPDHKMSSVETVCSAAVKSIVDSDCSLIVALTETGSTARSIAKYRPSVPILAITASETTVRQLGVVRGVVPLLTASFVGTDSVITKALKHAVSEGMCKSGDCVVAVHGTQEESSGHSNLLKVVTVP
jgi:pyruvate kinase